MKGGIIKCVGKGYYRALMDDGKLFNIIHSDFDFQWKVYSGSESAPEDRLGQFHSLQEAKQAIIDDFQHRQYADHKQVWYGTKWGLIEDADGNVKGIWRGTKPEGWHYNFLVPSWLEK